MPYVLVLSILAIGILLCFVCFDSYNRCVKQTVCAECNGSCSSNVESLDSLNGCTNCVINSLCVHEHDVLESTYLLIVDLPFFGHLPCCWGYNLPCCWGYVPCCWGHLPCCWGYSTCSGGEANCDDNAHGFPYVCTCDHGNVTACTIQEVGTVLQNDITLQNLTDLAITVSCNTWASPQSCYLQLPQVLWHYEALPSGFWNAQ